MKSTYFVLISSDFNNPFSKASINFLEQIQSYRHESGLHFDEKNIHIKAILSDFVELAKQENNLRTRYSLSLWRR